MRRRPGKLALWAFLVLGLAALVYRFAYGLGAATNLNDNFPWGLWIGLDVMSGVALAAGGFVFALTVYVLNLKRYQPLLRPAILTAFIGYLMAAAGVVIDLGQPQRFWHPLVFWNIHSPLFEVSLCVMAYTLVLALEFSPVVAEGRGWQRAGRVLKMLTVPLVVAGIVLSTMHQSSLGTLMLIAVGRLHPLWFTGLLPVLFFISAVAAGLAVASVESYLSSRAFGRPVEGELLASIAKGTWWVLLLYGAVRFGDLAYSGRLGAIASGTMEAWAFVAEIGIGLVLPLILLAMASVRRRPGILAAVQGLVLAGVVLNRFDTALVGMSRALGGAYQPSLIELGISLGMLSGGGLLYIWAVENLPVFERVPEEPTRVVAASGH